MGEGADGPLQNTPKPFHGARWRHPWRQRFWRGPSAPSRQFPAGADGKGGIKGRSKSKKGSHRLPFLLVGVRALCVAKGSDPGSWLAFAHPSAERNAGWRGWVRLTGTVSGMDAAAKPPGTGLRRVPGSLTHPGPTANQQSAGNALNLTAPRKYPPHPCRCRCTSSPCRTSAGDDAGRAAGSRYGSRRSRPADGPGRSRRPAG